jgi:hypothetical protein
VWGAVSLLGLAVVLAGCGSSDDNTPQGRVRVINALTGVPNNANVDVNFNNNQASSTNIAYGAGDTSASTINAGANIPVTVFTTGTTNTLASSTGLNVAQGADNLLLVTGTVGAAGATAPQLVTVTGGTSTLALNITSNGQTVTTNPTPTDVAGGNTYAVVLTGVPNGNPAPAAKIIRLNP